MSTFFSDLFSTASTTPLTAHTADSGATWSRVYGTADPSVASVAGGIVAPAASNTIHLSSQIAGSADVSLTTVFHCDNGSAGAYYNAGVVFSANAAGTTGYVLTHDRNNNRWSLWSLAGGFGSLTTIAYSATAGLTNNAEYTVAITRTTISSSLVRIVVTVDGAQVISYDDTSANRVMTAGYVGVLFAPAVAGAGVWISSIVATDFAMATSYNVTGPTSGPVMVPAVFIVAPNGPLAAATIFTPSDSGGGGSWSPTTLTLTGSSSGTLTYTPGSTGAKSLTVANNGGLPVPTALAFTVAAPLVLVVKSRRPAQDRVRDTTTTASSAYITLTGTAPSGYRSFAAAYSVGTSGIPVYVGNASAWMTCLCTLRSSTLLTVDTILTSSAGGSAPTFDGRPREVFVTVPAAQVAPRYYVDLRDFDADPTFANDATAGIQQAINEAYSAGPARLYIPNGHYAIGGALNAQGNQLYIPNTRFAEHDKSLIIEGETAPNFEMQGLLTVPATASGALLHSTISGSGTRPSVIGSAAINAADPMLWNYTNISVRNIGIRTNVGSGTNSMCGLDLRAFAQIPEINHVNIDTDTPTRTQIQPVGSVGLMGPPVNNHAMLNVQNIRVRGYYTGLEVGEHFVGGTISALGCVNALVLLDGYHSSAVDMLSVEFCVNSIAVNGDHPLSVLTYSCEHDAGQGVAWVANVKDIVFNAGTRKVTIVGSTVVTGGVGIDDAAFAVTNPGTPARYKVLTGSGAN